MSSDTRTATTRRRRRGVRRGVRSGTTLQQLVVCAACGAEKAGSEYSRTQLAKPAGKCRCTSCIAGRLVPIRGREDDGSRRSPAQNKRKVSANRDARTLAGIIDRPREHAAKLIAEAGSLQAACERWFVRQRPLYHRSAGLQVGNIVTLTGVEPPRADNQQRPISEGPLRPGAWGIVYMPSMWGMKSRTKSWQMAPHGGSAKVRWRLSCRPACGGSGTQAAIV